MTNYLTDNEDINLVYANYWAFYQETCKIELRKMSNKLNLIKENDVGACFLYTGRAYEKVLSYNPRYELVEDYDYWIRICKRFNSMHYPQPLYIYTKHPKSLKSIRPHNIVLFDSLLKYQNDYISLFELIESIIRFFSNVIRSQKKKKEVTIRYIKNIFKISRLSIYLCLLSILLLIVYTVLKILKIYIRNFLFILRYPLEYINFFLSFNQKSYLLKVTKEKKNILCIVPHLAIGGAEKVVLNIAKGTDRKKFSFHIVTTRPAKNIWYNKYKPYFQNIIIPMKKNKNIYYKYFHHLIKKLNIDIVLISNSMIGYEYLPQLKSKFKHIKIIDLLHAEESFGASHKLEWVTPYFDKRICISHHLRNYMIKKYRKTRIREKYIKRLKVIHNGIDIKEYNSNPQMKGSFKSRFSITDDVKIISFIGRFSSEKNPLLYIDIAKKIITRLPNYKLKFVMSGDGPEFDNVRNTINRYGLEDYFILTRMIENIVELLADTYILLVVSKREGIPFVILEAMAMGVPVISTKVGAIYEVIKNNINGYLINTKNNVVDSFTCKIRDLLTEKTNYHILAKKTREMIISKFSVEIMGEKYQNVFNELISEGFD